jgi:hypothetical protein
MLRPGMPVSALYDIIGDDWPAPASGNITVNGCFSVRIDVAGAIGAVRLSRGFPFRIPVLGYHAGMSLQEASLLRPIEARGTNIYRTLALFRARIDPEYDVILYVDREEKLHSFELARPDAVYGEQKSLFDGTMVVISGIDQDDTRQMLDDWVVENETPETYVETVCYARWLSTEASPDDWHFAAENWDPDGDFVPIFWIIRQPRCEIATALETFYRNLPYNELDALQRKPLRTEKRDDLRLVYELRSRLLAGFYRQQAISFDGELAVRNAFGAKADTREIMQAIPPSMRKKYGTRAPIDQAGPWGDGYPDVLWRGRT